MDRTNTIKSHTRFVMGAVGRPVENTTLVRPSDNRGLENDFSTSDSTILADGCGVRTWASTKPLRRSEQFEPESQIERVALKMAQISDFRREQVCWTTVGGTCINW